MLGFCGALLIIVLFFAVIFSYNSPLCRNPPMLLRFFSVSDFTGLQVSFLQFCSGNKGFVLHLPDTLFLLFLLLVCPLFEVQRAMSISFYVNMFT